MDRLLTLLFFIAAIGISLTPVVVYYILREMIKIGRAKRILSKTDEWGEKNCEALVNGEISIGMTKEMVHQALGPPTKIDHQRQRWVYEWDYIKGWEHPPETATNVVMFRDDRVTEIKKEQ